MAFRQDVSFKACTNCSSRGSRFRHALFGTLLVEGYSGHQELAYPRLAAAFGTAYMEHQFHPWTPDAIHPMRPAGTILAWYAGRSFYNEYAREPMNDFTQRALIKLGLRK